jgi:tetratricopeptide (TPR) repeat protein
MFNAATFSWLSSIKTMAYEAAKAAMACLFCRKKGRRLGWRAFCIECVNIKERQKNNNNMYNDLIRLAKDYKKISVANLLKDIKNKSKKLTKLKSKDNLDKLIEFGQLLLKGGDQQHAIQVFSVVLELDPEHFTAMTYVAAIFEDVGQHQQALPLYTQAFESNQNNLNLASRIAWCQFKIGQHESSLGLMEKLISIKPDDVDYHQMTADMLFEIGQHDLAKELILNFITRIFDKGLCFTLAKHYFEVKDFASAVELFQSLNQQFPSQSEYEAHLAYALASNHEYEESRKWALKALRKDKYQLKAWNALGFYYFSLKANFSKAKKYYQKVLDIDPKDVECLVNVGFMAQKSGDFNSARASYQYVLQIEPNNREIRENLAVIYREIGFFRLGFELFEARIKPSFNSEVPYWNGSELMEGKRVLILNEQGIGDLYIEAWYFHLLPKNGCFVIEVDPRTLEIFRQSFPHLEFISNANDYVRSNSTVFDFYLYRSSLGVLFWQYWHLSDYWFYQTNRDEFLVKCKVIPLPKESDSELALVQKPLIGITWRSGLQVLGRNQYYFTVEEIADLIQDFDANFVILQYEVTNEEVNYLSSRLDNIILPDIDLKNDQFQLAQQILKLDVVVGVCNAVIALSSMLGVATIWIKKHSLQSSINSCLIKEPSKLSQMAVDICLEDSNASKYIQEVTTKAIASPIAKLDAYFDIDIPQNSTLWDSSVYSSRPGFVYDCSDLPDDFNDANCNTIEQVFSLTPYLSMIAVYKNIECDHIEMLQRFDQNRLKQDVNTFIRLNLNFYRTMDHMFEAFFLCMDYWLAQSESLESYPFILWFINNYYGTTEHNKKLLNAKDLNIADVTEKVSALRPESCSNLLDNILCRILRMAYLGDVDLSFDEPFPKSRHHSIIENQLPTNFFNIVKEINQNNIPILLNNNDQSVLKKSNQKYRVLICHDSLAIHDSEINFVKLNYFSSKYWYEGDQHVEFTHLDIDANTPTDSLHENDFLKNPETLLTFDLIISCHSYIAYIASLLHVPTWIMTPSKLTLGYPGALSKSIFFSTEFLFHYHVPFDEVSSVFKLELQAFFEQKKDNKLVIQDIALLNKRLQSVLDVKKHLGQPMRIFNWAKETYETHTINK